MYMLAVVKLRDTRTGEVVIYHDKAAYPSTDAAVAFWTEGECGCDCNRSLAIWKAKHGSSLSDGMPLPCRRVNHVIELVEIEILIVAESGAEVVEVITA